jgi:hypothetical protein
MLPDPSLIKLPEPVTIPPYVSVVEALVLIVPDVLKVIPLLGAKENVPVEFKPPPLNIRLSASAVPGVAPRLLVADIEIKPADKVVEPV